MRKEPLYQREESAQPNCGTHQAVYFHDPFSEASMRLHLLEESRMLRSHLSTRWPIASCLWLVNAQPFAAELVARFQLLVELLKETYERHGMPEILFGRYNPCLRYYVPGLSRLKNWAYMLESLTKRPLALRPRRQVKCAVKTQRENQEHGKQDSRHSWAQLSHSSNLSEGSWHS